MHCGRVCPLRHKHAPNPSLKPPPAPPVKALAVLRQIAWRVASSSVAVAIGLSREVVAIRVQCCSAQDGGG